MVPREVVTSIDDRERLVGFIFAGIGVAMSLALLLVGLIHGTVTETATRAPHNGKCPSLAGFHIVSSSKTSCSYELVLTKGDILFGSLLVFMLTGVLALFVYRRRRTGTVFASFIEGLAVVKYTYFWIMPLLGFAYVGQGGWLLLRAYRLQKYGAATRKGSREAVAARASGEAAPAPVAKAAEPVERRPAEASKRYTPKKQVKKRR
jgi:hypothetical protein